MDLMRLVKHLAMPRLAARRVFSKPALDRIEVAIRASESQHRGELRLAIETGLPLRDLLAGCSARQRGEELFSRLRVWDTADNSGVLIYFLLADRTVEIVADRGISARVPQAAWEAICRGLEQACREGRYEAGTLAAVGAITGLLAANFPVGEFNPNELSDRPVLL